MTVRTRIVRIGNSQGIRVPKPLLDQARLPEEVELSAEPGRLIVRAARPPGMGGQTLPEPCANPTLGSEIRKTRPCLVVPPDELNRHLRPVDRERLVTRLGRLGPPSLAAVLEGLQEMFSE